MSSKLTEEQLIAYLYGELLQEEKKAIEDILENNPEEKNRLDSFNQTRMAMNELGDEEPPESIFISPQMAEGSQLNYWRPFIGIAATLLIIMTFGWLTGFGIQMNEEGFQLGYQEEQIGLSSEEVAKLIEKDRQATVAQFKSMLEAGQDSIYTEIQSIEASINEQPALVYNQEKEDLMNDMIELSDKLSDDYREVMRQLIVSFSNNWQSQRIQDLQNIQSAFNDLEDATINNQLEIEDEMVRISERLDAVIANLNNNK